jgi:Zn-dependent protease
MTPDSRRMLRLLLISLAGFLGGLAAAVLAVALTPSGAFAKVGSLLVWLYLAAFSGGAAGAAILVGRGTARWIKPSPAGSLLDEPSMPSSATPDGAPASPALARLVRTPPPSILPPGLVFVVSFALFLLFNDRGIWVEHLVILAGVLLFHEAGHALGMLALGYRDVRIFFIPFFGAATAGKPDGGPGWRHGIVLLLGPMPGIVAGFVLALSFGAHRGTTIGYAVSTLVYVNAFNLLPIAPLDGGRLLELVLFGRHRFTEVLLKLASSAVFAFLAIRHKSFVLGLPAYLLLLGLPAGWVSSTAARELRLGGSALPRRVEDASDELIDDIDRWRLSARWGSRTVAARATWVRLVIERAIDAERAPGFAGSLALLAAWAGSVTFALAAIVVCARAR